MQYTLRKIPPTLDNELRERARDQNKSLNQVTLEALAHGLGMGAEPVQYRDLSDVVGKWREDSAFDQAVADQDVVDSELWK